MIQFSSGSLECFKRLPCQGRHHTGPFLRQAYLVEPVPLGDPVHVDVPMEVAAPGLPVRFAALENDFDAFGSCDALLRGAFQNFCHISALIVGSLMYVVLLHARQLFLIKSASESASFFLLTATIQLACHLRDNVVGKVEESSHIRDSLQEL